MRVGRGGNGCGAAAGLGPHGADDDGAALAHDALELRDAVFELARHVRPKREKQLADVLQERAVTGGEAGMLHAPPLRGDRGR